MSVLGNIQTVVGEIGRDVAHVLQSLNRKLDDAEGSVKSRHMGARPARTVLSNLGSAKDLPKWNGMNDLREALGFRKEGQTFFTSSEDLTGSYDAASNMVVYDPDGESRVEILSSASAVAASLFFGKITEASVAALRYYTNTDALDLVLPTGSALRVEENSVSGSAVKGVGAVLTDGEFSVTTNLADNVITDIDIVVPTGLYSTTSSTTGTMPPGTPGFGVVLNYKYNDDTVTQLFKSNYGSAVDTLFMRQRTNVGGWASWNKIGGGRTERGTIATSNTGGTLYTFNTPYNTAPDVSVVCVDGTSFCSATISAPTNTSVEVHTWDETGSRVSGTVQVIAIGD